MTSSGFCDKTGWRWSEHQIPLDRTFRIDDVKMPTMAMRLPIDQKGEFKFGEAPPYVQVAKGDGMAVDKVGRYYVTSEFGV